MKILITGGTGFIGKALSVELTKLNHELTLVSRDPKRFEIDWGLPNRFMKWDMEGEDCPESLDAFDAVIHLAGESIADGLWTEKRKKRIMDSRVKTTAALGRALALRRKTLSCLISASAIGYYPVSAEDSFDETSGPGQGFLPEVCQAWEDAVKALPKVEREIRFRFGLVLAEGGGFLQKLLLPSRLGLGAKVGDGRQWMSWIHRSDIIGMIIEALENKAYEGAINAVAPEPIRQIAFQKTLADLLHRPVFMRLPGFALKAALREFSHLLLDSQKILPTRLEALGYSYRFPRLEDAFREALDLREKNGRTYFCHRLEAVQFVPAPVETVFDFFCDPHNLERMTPPLLSFKIESVSTPEVSEGTIIHYRLKVHGVPMKWKTLIKDWRKNQVFVDNQESGPYAIWHHTHGFWSVKGGTLMTDTVRYRLPLGLLGEGVALALVQRDIRAIFRYRRLVIREEFGTTDAERG